MTVGAITPSVDDLPILLNRATGRTYAANVPVPPPVIPAKLHAYRYGNALQAIPNNVVTVALLGNVGTNNDAGMVTGDRYITVTKAATYLVIGRVHFAPNAAGVRRLMLRRSGAIVLSDNDVGEAGTSHSLWCQRIVLGNVGDTFELFAWQTSGGNLNIGNADANFSNVLQVIEL